MINIFKKILGIGSKQTQKQSTEAFQKVFGKTSEPPKKVYNRDSYGRFAKKRMESV